MAIISTTAGKNSLEKNGEEKNSHSQQKSLKQYLGAILKMAQWYQLVSKANYSVSQ